MSQQRHAATIDEFVAFADETRGFNDLIASGCVRLIDAARLCIRLATSDIADVTPRKLRYGIKS
eukprot:2910374-Pyramimonas_sp.AAC.1